jgi:hypothetical protein
MPIIIKESGLPYIRCAGCHFPIEEDGRVLWIQVGVPKFYFTHKRCVDKFCHDNFTPSQMDKKKSRGIEDFICKISNSIKPKPKAKK